MINFVPEVGDVRFFKKGDMVLTSIPEAFIREDRRHLCQWVEVWTLIGDTYSYDDSEGVCQGYETEELAGEYEVINTMQKISCMDNEEAILVVYYQNMKDGTRIKQYIYS